MRFFILGNINAGKSTLAKCLQAYFKDKGFEYPILSIDDFRKKFGDGTQKREIIAQNQFYLAIKKAKNAIVEMVGFGRVMTRMVENFDKNSCVIIYIKSPLGLCLKRLDDKKKLLANVPYPASLDSIENTINLLDYCLKGNNLQKSWEKICLKFYTLNAKNSLENAKTLPLIHYHHLADLMSFFKAMHYKKLITFGSLARDNMNALSDIDLILITKKDISVICIEIKSFFAAKISKIYILEEKIVIKFSSQIIAEIAVVSNFSKYVKFYFGSNIKDISKSILIGNKALQDKIKNSLKSYIPSPTNESIYIKKLFYYFDLLQRASEDDFRFYFFNNLIITQITRVLCLRENISEFLYCPKNINPLLEKYQLKSLIWDMQINKKRHINKLSKFLKSLEILPCKT